MLEKIILNLQSKDTNILKPNMNIPVRKSLLVQSQVVVRNFQNKKSLCQLFNSLDEGKISKTEYIET